jgi:hypothetical protein
MIEKENPTWLDVIQEAQSTLRDCQDALTTIAEDFDRIGNNYIAKKLDLIAIAIGKSERAIYSAVGTNLDEQIRSVSEASNNLLQAALAGIRLATDIDVEGAHNNE